MKRLTVIRTLVVVEIASITASLLLCHFMPWPLSMHDFLNAPDLQGYTTDALSPWILIPFVLLILVAWIGLWVGWAFARYIYLGTLFLAVPFILLSPPTAVLPTEELFSGLAYMASGALLLVLFIQPHIKSH
jgi:hypothetical protein